MKIINFNDKKIKILENRIEKDKKATFNIVADTLVLVCKGVINNGVTDEVVNDLTETLKDYKYYKKYGVL